jgi:RNA polymerase sigma-70 factor (ECF subfamily)
VVTQRTLIRARAGDEDAFRELTDPYRREVELHCYRIVGSLQDAEDLLQETLLAAWRGLGHFEERASLRGWLYRIATNRCLNMLRDRRRRPREVPPMGEPPEPTRRADPIWLEPYPDVLLDGVADISPAPEARYELREAVGLAFVAALQHLPPRQRAALVLRDVLGFHGAEVADMLESSEASVKAALQRARATLETRLPAGARERAPLPSSARERELVGRFVDAAERGDIDGIVSLLTGDAWLTMPPQPYGTKAPSRSPGSWRTARRGAALPSGLWRRGRTVSPRSAATYPTRRQRSLALTGCWSSRCRASASRPSPGSSTSASSPTSDFHERFPTSSKRRCSARS